MSGQKITEYRTLAAECESRAKAETDRFARVRWEKLALEWARLADQEQARTGPSKTQD